MQNNLTKIIDEQNYLEIKTTIENFTKSGREYLTKLLNNLKITLINLENNDSDFIKTKNNLKNIFDFLVYLNKNINYESLINNINYDTNEYRMSLDDKYRIFLNIIKIIFNEKIDIYNNYYNNKIKNLDGIYIACFLDLYYSNSRYLEQLESLEYIMPELFKQYPMYEYYKILYIESIIEEENNDSDD